MTEVTRHGAHIGFESGWTVPDPDSEELACAVDAACYGTPTRQQMLLLASVAAAYRHFACYPAPNLTVVGQLKQLRNEVQKNRKRSFLDTLEVCTGCGVDIDPVLDNPCPHCALDAFLREKKETR